jgi:hypothetical protein
MAEAQTGALDLETVTAAVDDVVEADACSDVTERAAREDHEPDPLARREARQRRPDGRREHRRARGGDDRGQGPVVVEDREEGDTASELSLKAREKAGREAQDALTAGASSGIRASSLSSNPAQR